MKYAHIVTGLGLILKAQRFHQTSASRYNDLFQQESSKHGHSLNYTALQVFYQTLALRHKCAQYYYEQAEVRYRELVDLAILDTETGLEPGDDAEGWLRSGT